ncbi:hypothetical protein EV361DRAFT_865301, partial [Lentinula raphanica]
RSVGLAIVKTKRKDGTVLRASDAWKGIDYVKFAQIWNSKVDAQDPTVVDSNKRLYYKLPEQLLRHHKKSLERQASQATMVIESNAVLVQAHIDSVKDSKRVAYVLPAVPLEDLSSQPDLTVNGNAHPDSQFEGSMSDEPPPNEPPPNESPPNESSLNKPSSDPPALDGAQAQKAATSSGGSWAPTAAPVSKESTILQHQSVLSFGKRPAHVQKQSETKERPAKRRKRKFAWGGVDGTSVMLVYVNTQVLGTLGFDERVEKSTERSLKTIQFSQSSTQN